MPILPIAPIAARRSRRSRFCDSSTRRGRARPEAVLPKSRANTRDCSVSSRTRERPPSGSRIRPSVPEWGMSLSRAKKRFCPQIPIAIGYVLQNRISRASSPPQSPRARTAGVSGRMPRLRAEISGATADSACSSHKTSAAEMAIPGWEVDWSRRVWERPPRPRKAVPFEREWSPSQPRVRTGSWKAPAQAR